MYRGKTTCKILKEIRKQLAKENDIAFVTSECKYQGDCLGTCPACEADKRWNKQCENATKKAIKSMPRWVPGKDEKGFPVRCYKSGDVIIGDSIQVWFNN